MSPLLILSTYSAVTFNGPITASNVLLKPIIIFLNSPSNCDSFALLSNFPSYAAVDTSFNSFTIAFKLLDIIFIAFSNIPVSSFASVSKSTFRLPLDIFSEATTALFKGFTICFVSIRAVEIEINKAIIEIAIIIQKALLYKLRASTPDFSKSEV